MITKPTLLLDERKCRENIQRMSAVAKKHQLNFRPHFKTHQSLEIGQWFKAYDVTCITVSSVTMAEYFSSDWDDITIAFPVNVLEIDSINALAARITLNLVVENLEAVKFLASRLSHVVNILFKIDVGYHRTGINPQDKILMDELLLMIEASPWLQFQGFLGHAGHSYQCRSEQEIRKVHASSLAVMKSVRSIYSQQYPTAIVSLGDTPGCSVADDFSGVSEIRPGNFAFYDLAQCQIGSTSVSNIAVAMACPIVALHQDRSEIVVYGGGAHFSKERLEEAEGTVYGRVVKNHNDRWGDVISGMYVKSLSQEHGIVSVPDELITQYAIGDYLLILPVHSCMTVNIMKSYRTLEGIDISTLA